MTDTDDDLRDRLQAELRIGTPEPPSYDALVRRASARRWRNRGVLLSIVGAVAIAGVVALTQDNSEDAGVDVVSPRSTTTEPDRAFPADLVATAPSPPIEVRGDAAVAWTGQELVVWGGDVEAANMGLPGEDRTFADGAAYEPTSETWRVLSPSPLPNDATTPEATMTPAGLAIVRGTSAALWRPEDNTWQELPPAARPMEDLHVAGNVLVSVSGAARLDLRDPQRWEDIPPVPERLERATSAWFGDGLLVVGGPGTPFTQAAAYRYDLDDDAWRATSPVPDGLSAEALAAGWDGRRVVVANYDMRAVTYDPDADVWNDLPDVPARFSEHYPTATGANGVSLVGMSQALVVLTPDDRWVPLPYGALPAGEHVHADVEGSLGRLLTWTVNVEDERNQLTIIDVDDLVDEPASIQVGSAALALPTGTRLELASIDRSATSTETVRADLTGPSDACVVTSTYVGLAKLPDELPVEEQLDNDGVATDWRRSVDQLRWQSQPTGSDRLEITCESGDIARALAEGASFGPHREP